MNNINISSTVIYLQEKSNPTIPIFMFGYKIKIENKTDDMVQLLNRHWEITDEME